jgi:hypothetical protein
MEGMKKKLTSEKTARIQIRGLTKAYGLGNVRRQIMGMFKNQAVANPNS